VKKLGSRQSPHEEELTGKRIVKCWAGAVVAIGVLSVPFLSAIFPRI